jgi:hypothetical protein
MEGFKAMSFENHQTGTRDYIAKLEKELAEKDKEIKNLKAMVFGGMENDTPVDVTKESGE